LRKGLIIAGVVLAALIAAALIVPSFLDWNKYRGEIESVAEAATGRDVRIEGDVSFAVLPMPSLTAEKVALANLPAGEAKDMATLDALEVRVGFWPLLFGRVEVQKIVLVKPVIALEVLPDGRKNWEFASTKKEGQAEASDGAISLQRFVIKDGTLSYVDLATNKRHLAKDINLSLSADGRAGPFDAEGRLSYRDVPIKLDLSMGRRDDKGAAPVKAKLGLGNADVRLDGDARLEDALGCSGEFSAEADKLTSLLAAAKRLGGGKEEAMAFDQPLQAQGKIAYGDDKVAVSDLQASLGESQLAGSLTLGLSDAPTINAALKASSLDLDAILAALPPKPEDAPAMTPDDLLKAFDLGDFSGPIEVTADAIRYRGQSMQQAEIKIVTSPRETTIRRAHLRLPGDTDVTVSGALARDGDRRFDGRVKMSSKSLRDLLQWLEAVPADVSANRLQAFSLDGALTVLPAAVIAKDATVKLDATTARGVLRYDLGTPRTLTLDASVDRLNLDGYVAKDTCTFGDDAAKPATPPAAPKAKAETLTTMTVKARIGQFSCEELTGRDLAVDLSMTEGGLAIRKLSAAALAGLAVDMTGTVRGEGEKQRYKLSGKISGQSLAEANRVAPGLLPLPPNAVKSGPVDVTFSLDGAPDRIAFNTSGALGPSRFSGVGAMTPAEKGKEGFRSLDATITLAGNSLSAIIGQWELGLRAPLPQDDKPVSLRGALKGPATALDLDLKADVAGGQAAITGTLHRGGEAMTYEMKVKVSGKDARAFVRGLGVGFAEDAEPLGALNLATDITRSEKILNIKGLSGQFGPVKINGAATVNLAGARPMISGDFSAGAIELDRFMKPAPKPDKAKKDTPPPPRPWSKEPFNTAWLKTFDANVKLRADSLTARGYRFEQPKLTVVVNNGQLRVDGLTGKLFDGDVALDFAFGGAAKSPLNLKFDIRNASMEKALTTAANTKAVTGTMNLSGAFSGAGASPYDLARSIDGKAQIGLSDGIVRGIDMPRLANGLKTLRDTGGLGSLIGGALAGGQTKHKGFAGTVTSKDGELDLSNLVVELEAAKALLGAKVSLPNWSVASAGKLQLNDQPQVPPIGVNIGGALNAPNVTYDTKAFRNHMAMEIGRAILQSTTSGGGLKQLLQGKQPATTETAPATEGTTTAPSEAQPSTQPAPAKPEDAGKVLFQELLKKLDKKKTPAEQPQQ